MNLLANAGRALGGIETCADQRNRGWQTPVVGNTAPVVVADEAALRPRTASVPSHRAEGRAAPTELRCLLEHKLVLHMPEASGPEIDLDILLLDRVGW